MNGKWKAGLVAVMIAGLAAAGCADEEASVVMLGSAVGEGEIQESDDGEVFGSCEFEADMDEPVVRSTGFINLNDIDDPGQVLVPGTTVDASPNRYIFESIFENQLFDSRSVGAVSGGDGGGFENLELDKNDIIIKSATVEFSGDNNTLALEGGEATFDAIDSERLVSMLVHSGGGVSTLGVPVVNNPNEVEAMENFMNEIGAGDDDIITLVAEIQLHGETLGGNEVESNRIEFPIDVCLDCDNPTDARCTI